MADDYLGRKMEEYMARKASGQSNRRPLATLGRLLLKNRSHRGYDTGFVVREDQQRFVGQVEFLFDPLLVECADADAVQADLRCLEQHALGRDAQIHVDVAVLFDCRADDDKGIRLGTRKGQAECGQGSAKADVRQDFVGFVRQHGAEPEHLLVARRGDPGIHLDHAPELILAVGKGIEKIELVPIGPSDSHTYYRENGTHYVPKLRAEELTIKE